jgi:hypothetical protein
LCKIFFEAVFGICAGCKVYHEFHQGGAKHCPGHSCDLTKKKTSIQSLKTIQRPTTIEGAYLGLMKSRIKKSSKKTDTMSLVGALLPVKKPLGLLFFEAVFGICAGCKVYHAFHQGGAKHCPGHSCDLTKKKASIQSLNFAQKTIFTLSILAR